MHAVDWMIVLLLNGAIIGYGFYLARGTSSSSDWFLGRRALPWWAIGLSMFATNVDNADLVSVTGKTYTEGLHLLTVYATGSALGGILASFYIVPAMYRAGFYTNAEYLEARFGPATRVLSALIQLQYRSSMLGLIILSVHLLLTGLNIVDATTSWALIVAIVICSGIYTAWGGLKSVVWTDALQSVVMMVGSVVIFVTLWQAAGGWSGTLQKLAARDASEGTHFTDLVHLGRFNGGSSESPYLVSWNGQTTDLAPYVVIMGWTIVGCGYWTVNHTQTMRLMGARSLWDMKMAATVGVALSLPLMIACACMGVMGRVLPGTEQLDHPDSLYPQLAREFLGVGLKGLVVAGVVAAAISTFDSMGSALSAIFTRDIYARLLVRGREDHHYVIVGRIATVIVLLSGFIYLPFILMQRNMIDAFVTLIPVFVTPLFTMYVLGAMTRIHRRSGIIGLLCGSAYGMFALYCRESRKISWLPEVDQVPRWLTDHWAAFGWSLLITTGAMLVAHLVWTKIIQRGVAHDRAEPILEVEHEGWLARSSEELPELREHPFAGDIPVWADPRIYAALLMALCIYVIFFLFW
ncbi:MAG: sodium/solute symporter [Pirellulaceae bacterium]